MSLSIRLAQPSDALVIPQIEEDAGQLFRSVEGLEWLAEQQGGSEEGYLRLIQMRTVWVAENAIAPCGFLAARIEASELHIVEMSVRRDCQRQGVARMLLQRAGNEARQLGLMSLTLTTFRDVPWNAPFYARLGFEELEERGLPDWLRRQLDSEADRGLPRQRRCAMRLSL